MVEGIFKQLAAALATLSEELHVLIASTPSRDRDARDATQQLGSPSFAREDLDELSNLLDSQNMAAFERFDALSCWLREWLNAGCFDDLKCAIDNLEFSRGAELLRSALRERGFDAKAPESRDLCGAPAQAEVVSPRTQRRSVRVDDLTGMPA